MHGQQNVKKKRRMKWRTCSTYVREAYRRKPEGKRPLGRLRRRWEDNIKTDL